MPYKNSKSPQAIISNIKKDKKYKESHRELLSQRDKEKRLSDPLYRQKCIEKSKNYRIKNREKVLKYKKEHHLKTLYGLSVDEYNTLLINQGNVCSICGKTNLGNRNLAVDHNHNNNKVRSLLCDKCNRGLGFFNDDKILLLKAMEYIKKYE